MRAKKLTEKKRFHLFVLCIYPFAASLISLATNATPFTSTLIFLGVPALYLSVLFRSFMRKSAMFSVILAIPFIFIVDYLGHFNHQWYITQTVFPVRILGLVPFEDVLWAFLLAYFMLMFYEYFFDTRRSHAYWPAHLKYLIAVLTLVSVIILFLSQAEPSLLTIRFFYLDIGTIAILLPLIIEFVRKPRLMPRAFIVGAYFFVFALIYELTALRLGWLTFPGTDFVGWVSLLNLSFPFEEFFFWILLTAMAAVVYYEFFDDDEQ